MLPAQKIGLRAHNAIIEQAIGKRTTWNPSKTFRVGLQFVKKINKKIPAEIAVVSFVLSTVLSTTALG